MKNNTRILVIGLLALLLLAPAGLAKGKPGSPDIPYLAQQLDESLRQPVLKNQELAILTFVEQDRLDRAQGLGRYLQERLGFELFNLGYRIVEIRLGKTLATREGRGETILSRVQEQLRQAGTTGLRGVVTGTYTVSGRTVYVQARLIDLEHGQVRAMGELTFPVSKALLGLLALESQPTLAGGNTTVYERFPAFPLPPPDEG